MSTPPQDPPAPPETGSVAPHPGQQRDRVHMPRVLTVAAATLLSFAVGITWAYRILIAGDPQVRGPGSTAGAHDIGRAEIGIVDQVVFEGDARLERRRQREGQQLDSYGWIDRARGIIHIPIDEAMSRVLREAGAAP
jgi:hypothetical protein